jgi:hypothetical protein
MEGVFRVRINADETKHLTLETCLFEQFSQTSLLQSFTQIHMPPRQTPQTIVGAFGQKDLVSFIENHRVHSDLGGELRLMSHRWTAK